MWRDLRFVIAAMSRCRLWRNLRFVIAAMSTCRVRREDLVLTVVMSRCCVWRDVPLVIAAISRCRAGGFVRRDVAVVSEYRGGIDGHLGPAVAAPSIGYLLLAVRLLERKKRL